MQLAQWGLDHAWGYAWGFWSPQCAVPKTQDSLHLGTHLLLPHQQGITMATTMSQMRGAAASTATASCSRPAVPMRSRSCKVAARHGAAAQLSGSSFTGHSVGFMSVRTPRAGRALARVVCAVVKDGEVLNRKLRVAVIGGGPSGACAAETLAEGGVEAFLFERKLDNCKVGWLRTGACAGLQALQFGAL
jgi:hypothetical protein